MPVALEVDVEVLIVAGNLGLLMPTLGIPGVVRLSWLILITRLRSTEQGQACRSREKQFQKVLSCCEG